VVAEEQFQLSHLIGEIPTDEADDETSSLELQNESEQVIVRAKNFALKIDKRDGSLQSYRHQDRELLAGPLQPNFWRAPTDNDNGNNMTERLGVWQDAAAERKVHSCQTETLPSGAVQVTVQQQIAQESPLVTTYTVQTSGAVQVSLSLDPQGKLPEMPRFGMQVKVPGELDQATWFGRGPHENYVDRLSSALVSRYVCAVTDFHHVYTRPQENGNRTGVRWFALTDKSGQGLLFVGEQHLSVSAWPYSQEDLAEADHIHELPQQSSQVTLNIDGAQMGVGGDNSWGALPYPEYTLPPVPRTYSFVLMPYEKSQGDVGDVARAASQQR